MIFIRIHYFTVEISLQKYIEDKKSVALTCCGGGGGG